MITRQTAYITIAGIRLTVRGDYEPPCSATNDTPGVCANFYAKEVEAEDSIVNLWPMIEGTKLAEEIEVEAMRVISGERE